MNRPEGAGNEADRASARLRADDICDRFEAGWLAGSQPQIEQHLCDVPEPERDNLLVELLALELEIRRDRGEQPTPEEYEQRFPHAVTLVRKAFHQASQPETAPGGPDSLPASPTPSGVSQPGEDTAEVLALLDPPQGPEEIGRLGGYRVLKLLGAGGMGVVLQAEEVPLKRLVALKLMRPALAASATARRRFLREAQAMAAVRHDHVVVVYQVVQGPGVPFLAMEFLEGETLASRLDRLGTLPPTQVMRIGKEIAAGLQAAHERGLVHRDIKPGNIWLEAERGDRVKILDFGLARAAGGDTQLTRTGQIVGTPAYMAPEQARGEPVDHCSDLFSLGCLLYRMCTGQSPFKGRDTVSILMSVVNDHPPQPRQVNPHVSPGLSGLVMRLLAKTPAERPSSAKVVAEELGRLEQELPPVTAAVAPSKSPFLPELDAAPTGKDEPAFATSVSHHYFAAQRELIEAYTRQFVGRARVWQALEHFRAGHRRGYFIVRGGPGQGKTAVASQLVKAYQAVHHFVSRAGGRGDVRLILQSLLAQLVPLAGAPAAVPETIPELAKQLEDLLTRAVARQKRLLLVLDALDELPAEAGPELPFVVTDGLPEGAHVVVTSRPGNRLERLCESCFAVPHEVYDLESLQLSEVGEILRARRPALTDAEVENIATASQGNPLYLRAVADELERDLAFDLRNLPAGIEGFFHRATSGLRDSSDPVLHDVLGLLTVTRKSLSLRELSQITGVRQRQLYDRAIQPIRQFLLQTDDCYGFYHASFHEFVTGELLYGDELPEYHGRLASWLLKPESRANDYCWTSLSHHLFGSGNYPDLLRWIDEAFLKEKVRRFGYAVLEDIELLTNALLEVGDPSLVERCVGLVEGLRREVGGDLIEDARRSVQGYRLGPAAFWSQVLTPAVPAVPGVDVWVGLVPKLAVGADFFEVVPLGDRLILVLGDAPGAGLKPAFVARFVGNLCRRLVKQEGQNDPGGLLRRLNEMLSGHDYFQTIAVQCAKVDPKAGVVTIANAGLPNPVLYTARRGRCDILPLRGELLHAAIDPHAEPPAWEARRAEMGPGDVLVMETDGLTEPYRARPHAYQFRFTRLVEEQAEQTVRSVGEAILDDWRSHLREGDYVDDVTVVVAAVKGNPAGE
jgi:serine/threonine protein kinase